MAGTWHALLIGIDRYPNLAAQNQRHEFANDTRAMVAVLDHVFAVARGDIARLTDKPWRRRNGRRAGGD